MDATTLRRSPRVRFRLSSRAVTVRRMRAIETHAISHYRIPRLLLMEHAGLAVCREVLRLVRTRRSRIVVCCGGGYNGGDGCVAARHLVNAGQAVTVWSLGRRSSGAPECTLQLEILERLGVRVYRRPPPPTALRNAAVIVDGLLGMGLHEDVREPYASTIRAMNVSGRPIIAVDVPSGVDADTGRPCGVAVRARCTITFGLAKRGLLTRHAKPFVGRLIVDPIGFPTVLLR